MIKIGVIGLGRIGKVHLENIQYHIPTAKVVAACSGSEKGFAFAKERGVQKCYTSVQQMLAEVELDAVVLASPTALHFEHLKLLITARKHIFCEKPIDLSLENVQFLKKELDQNPVKFMVGFNRRYDPTLISIKKQLDQKKLGQPQSIKLTSRDPGPPPMEFIKTSGGLFLDMAIHDFDLASYLMGSEVTEVYATASVFGELTLESVGDVDTAVTVLKFKNKGFATIENSRNSVYGYDQRLEVFGAQGMLSSTNQADTMVSFSDQEGVHHPKPVGFFIERYQASYLNIMKAFIKALEQNETPELSFQDGLHSLTLCLAAKKSSEENRLVLLSEIR